MLTFRFASKVSPQVRFIEPCRGPMASSSPFRAAFLGHFDFIYALPSAWLSVPFTFLGEHLGCGVGI